MTARFRLENIVRRYRQLGSGRSAEVLRVPQLEVAAGEIVAVIGPNGSGKSTLLETMAFLHAPEEGRVHLDGQDVWAEGAALAARRQCPMLLQRNVLFKTTVLRNIMYGLRVRGVSRHEACRRAEEVMALVRLEALARRGHRELSGGERQRVALARLLALRPATLLLDEPTAHVDHANAQLIEDIIHQMHQETGMTVVLASHDSQQAHKLAGRVVTLFDGQLITGTMDNLLRGRICQEPAGLLFCSEDNVRLALSPAAFPSEVKDGLPSPETRIQVAVDAERIEVQVTQRGLADPAIGLIEAVQQIRGRCRLRIRMTRSRTLDADLMPAEYQRLGLNIGTSVVVRIGDGGLRLLHSM